MLGTRKQVGTDYYCFFFVSSVTRAASDQLMRWVSYCFLFFGGGGGAVLAAS